ncbi:MAG: DUF302 domain-containing protein [Lautropia sp.]|nr:DUF302 domain-containing protein [Lautropia sp.]
MKFPWIQSLVLSMAVVSGGAAFASQGAAMPDVDGLLTVKSAYSASESVQRIQDALKAKGLTIFTVIDHQKAAEAQQLKMPAASVIVFGNPKLGTPMMVQSPTMAIDLPSKVLVWEDGKGNVFASMNTAAYMGKRHHLPESVYGPLAGLEKLVPNAVK